MEKVPRSVCTKEFKEEAAKMVIEGGLSQPEVCRRLSLANSTLARWVRQARNGGISTSVAKRSPVNRIPSQKRVHT